MEKLELQHLAYSGSLQFITEKQTRQNAASHCRSPVGSNEKSINKEFILEVNK